MAIEASSNYYLIRSSTLSVIAYEVLTGTLHAISISLMINKMLQNVIE